MNKSGSFFQPSRRAFLGAGVLAAAMLATAACGGPAKESGGVGTAEKPVELRILANDGYAKQWQEQMVPEFNKKFPNIKVTIDGVPYGDQLAKTMLELTAADPTYDIVMADDPWIPQMASTGALLDLKKDAAEWTDAAYDWNDFNSAPLAAGEWEGVQYGVPLRSNMLMMFYNKALYKDAGVPEPTPELTWDDYMSQAPKLVRDTNGDGKDDTWAVGTYFTRDPLTPTVWQTIFNANGGELLDGDNKPAFNNAVGVAALQTHVEMLKYAPPGASTWQFTEPLEAFRQGKTATMFNWGSVYKGTAIDPKTTTLTADQVGIQVMPAGTNSSGAHRGIWSGAIASRGQNTEAAWKLVEWLSSSEGEVWQSNTLGVFPARTSTLDSTPEQAWLSPVFDALKMAYADAETGKMWRPRLTNSDEVQRILADETAVAMANTNDAAKALDDAAAEIEKALTK
ncbi:ABC transporter substrate-binding protein [Arthrobacter glacialis]|nr:sugar ABC transporter substrate-binding protein [Arthrobacter glacialis]